MTPVRRIAGRPRGASAVRAGRLQYSRQRSACAALGYMYCFASLCTDARHRPFGVSYLLNWTARSRVRAAVAEYVFSTVAVRNP